MRVSAPYAFGLYTQHTQKNGAVSIEMSIVTAPLFCVYPVLGDINKHFCNVEHKY
jgi:hypothetical protein